jgi:hypothetical protein
MATFRPCRVCSRWFRPNSRVGNRQHVCGEPACQKEWHRRSCAKGRKLRLDDTRATKVARLVVKRPVAEQAAIDPLAAIDWKGVRKVVGLEVMVTVREILKVLRRGARETSTAQPLSFNAITPRLLARGQRETSSEQPICNHTIPTKVLPPGPRDEMASRPGVP